MPPTSHRGVGCVNVVEIAGAGGDSEEILAGLSSLVKAIARRPWFPESNSP